MKSPQPVARPSTVPFPIGSLIVPNRMKFITGAVSLEILSVDKTTICLVVRGVDNAVTPLRTVFTDFGKTGHTAHFDAWTVLV